MEHHGTSWNINFFDHKPLHCDDLKRGRFEKHFLKIFLFGVPHSTGAGATFDWLFFDNSKLIDFDC